MTTIDPATSERASSTREKFASWILGGPLALALALLCLVELVTWAPSYLTWPYWADHDVFSTAAHGWDRGVLPYRDSLGNNFPGTIYLFWALGKLAGWSYTPAFWAADVALLLVLGAGMLAWSRRHLGRFLPGWVGYAAILGYYLNLDYSQAGQRDWHAPVLACLGIMAAETWPGRTGRWLAALGMASALTIRPQAVLLAPAMLLAVLHGRKGRPAGAIIEWVALTTLLLMIGFAPLAQAGLLGDFARSLKRASVGGSYNQLSPSSFVKYMAPQILNFRYTMTACGLLLLSIRNRGPAGRSAHVWLVALAATSLYRPLSPNPVHAYLAHPLAIVWCISASVLVELILEERTSVPSMRLASALLVLGLAVGGKPRFCNPAGSLEALTYLRRGVDPDPKPTGYAVNDESHGTARYEWDDYRHTLEYLRHQVGPDVKIANHLVYVPALCGPTGHLSAFPAESSAWIRVVLASDEPIFDQALKDADDALVVWDPIPPGKPPRVRFDAMEATIRRLYEPIERFGPIEIWRRKR